MLAIGQSILDAFPANFLRALFPVKPASLLAVSLAQDFPRIPIPRLLDATRDVSRGEKIRSARTSFTGEVLAASTVRCQDDLLM